MSKSTLGKKGCSLLFPLLLLLNFLLLSAISSSGAVRLTTTTMTTTAPSSGSGEETNFTSLCGDGWDLDVDSRTCYFIPHTNDKADMKNWRDAQTFCTTLPIASTAAGNGSFVGEVPRLVDIVSEKEQKFLERTIQARGLV